MTLKQWRMSMFNPEEDRKGGTLEENGAIRKQTR